MDVKRHSHIYDDLLKFNIELNFQDVPTPSYIQELLIKCNSYQLKVERFFIEITRDLAITERMFSTERLNLDMLTKNTLTNNEKIKKIPTGKEREAAVAELLEDNHRELLKLENDVNDLKSILSAIRQKQSTLKSTNADVKSLQKLMEQQVNRLNIGHPDDPDVKELSQAFSEIDKLEEDFDIDEVESSVEMSQSEDSEEVVEEESVKFDVSDTLVESVASQKSDTLDELLVFGDELTPESIPTDTQESSSQNTKNIGEITTVASIPKEGKALNPELKGSLSSATQDALDIEDELASLLTEDDSDATQPDDEDREGEEQISIEETIVKNDSVANIAESVETPDIEIDDDMSLDVESKVSEPPKVEVDLSDIGFDLDFGIEDTPEIKKSTPRTNEKKPTNETGSVKTDVKKSTDTLVKKPPVENKKPEGVKTEVKKAEVKKPDVKKTDTLDIDLNDILNGI
jgi:hypothetical protein